jgi:hypothetical protein
MRIPRLSGRQTIQESFQPFWSVKCLAIALIAQMFCAKCAQKKRLLKETLYQLIHLMNEVLS